MYQQVYDPVADSLGLTSLLAAIPLTLMFVMLGVFKRSPQLSALVSLAATVAVATLVYPMPFSAALNSGLFGVAFAILTIAWILVNAMWIYNMTVETGYFGVLRESFCRISDEFAHPGDHHRVLFRRGPGGFRRAHCNLQRDAGGDWLQSRKGGRGGPGRQHRAGRLWGAGGSNHDTQQDDGSPL